MHIEMPDEDDDILAEFVEKLEGQFTENIRRIRNDLEARDYDLRDEDVNWYGTTDQEWVMDVTDCLFKAESYIESVVQAIQGARGA